MDERTLKLARRAQVNEVTEKLVYERLAARCKDPRNAEVLRTISYWGEIYDPRFLTIFTAYSSRTLQSLSTTWEIKNFNYAKRLFLEGVTGFFNYQVSGRSGTAEIARDKFTWCSYTLKKVVKESHPMDPMAEWFLRELDQPPELQESSG